MVDFANLLNVKSADAKRPDPVPPGTYLCRVHENFETGESANKGTPFIRFKLAILAPEDDVDTDSYEGGAEAIIGRNLTHTFWLSIGDDGNVRTDMVAMLKEFMEDCGIELDDDTEVGAYLPELQNAEVKVNVTHRPSPNNPEVMLIDITGSAAA
jgi:hypothetical protein